MTAILDMNNNRISDNVEKIHLIAVCGTVMGALACMLADLGFDITGSDMNVYPPISKYLADRGIEIFDGYNAKHIEYKPDLVVVGNAVSKDNPEVLAMLKMGLNFCSMPQAINRFAADGKKKLVIAGTHGKTTISSILACLLYEAGRIEKKYDPSFFIGGILKNFGRNYRIGKGEYIIIEGDEYDTAFFDKGSKFLHYDPFIAVLTSVEFDHADIFKDISHVKESFSSFLSKISSKSALFAYDNDNNVSSLIASVRCLAERYGNKAGSDWRIEDISIEPPWTFFSVLKHGSFYGKFKTRLLGEHNLLNAIAAIGVADRLEIPLCTIKKALEKFEGVKRRQEIRGVKNRITVIDDFAHHPTAVKETIRAVKPFCTNGRLIAVFEPRTNTSMRNLFQDIYPYSFDQADIICIRKPPLLNKIPEGERFSSEKLVDDLCANGNLAHYFENTEDIIVFLADAAKPGDVVLIMSNGGFDNIHERLLINL